MAATNSNADGSGDGVAGRDKLQVELEKARRALEDCERRSRDELHELQRQFRNTLALIRSVFARTIETGESLEEIESHFVGRLDVLVRYQNGSRLEDEPLEDIIRNELQDFRFGHLPGVTIEGPDVLIPAEQAQSLALAMHELVTNALKFGALCVDGATLSVTWTVSDNVLELAWAESGVPVVLPASLRRGFSRQYIEEALPYQIGAETRFKLRPDGLLCLIHLPLRDREDRLVDSAA